MAGDHKLTSYVHPTRAEAGVDMAPLGPPLCDNITCCFRQRIGHHLARPSDRQPGLGLTRPDNRAIGKHGTDDNHSVVVMASNGKPGARDITRQETISNAWTSGEAWTQERVYYAWPEDRVSI